MKLAKVIGTVVATVKVESIENQKILLIQPLDGNMKEDGRPIAAMDPTQAGPGQLVWWTVARESTLALPEPFAPVDAAITGIVDEVDINDVGIKDKNKVFD